MEVRGRTGVYLARQDRIGGGLNEESVSWLASVLAESRRRRIGIPQFPEFVRKCTADRQLRCVCIESNVDSGVALMLELEEEFGLSCEVLEPDALPSPKNQSAPLASLRNADVLITTAFHARTVRAVAARLNKPLVTVTVSEELARIIERRVAAEGLTAIVADRRYGERLRDIYGRDSAGKGIRILDAGQRDEVLLLDRSEPVLVTRAARRLLPDLDVAMLVPRYPSISAESARDLAELIIRLNLAAVT